MWTAYMKLRNNGRHLENRNTVSNDQSNRSLYAIERLPDTELKISYGQ